MTRIGRVESLWRYPVKSMAGEMLDQAYFGFPGVYGDRLYAFTDSAARPGFPFLTARELASMLLHHPRFRDPRQAAAPPNLEAAQSLSPGITPLYGAEQDMAVEVRTPDGEVLAVDDPRLLEGLARAAGKEGSIALRRSERALADCRPVSLLSLQTVRQLSTELSRPLDLRRFRANIYADMEEMAGYAEADYVGRTLAIGAQLRIVVLGPDPRCKMIALDPDTAELTPEIMRHVARMHDGMAGVYAAVLAEGVASVGDEIVVE
jgi:uncharacterized protein YcbX